MVSHTPALIRRLALSMAALASALSVRAALLGIVVPFAVFLSVVMIAPPPVSLALTVAVGIGSCVWLEKHPDPQVTWGGPFEAKAAVPGAMPTIHVIATTPQGTKCALEAARRLTGGTDDRVILFVPRPLTAFGAPFDPSGQERAVTIDRYRQIAADVGVPVRVFYCVCRRFDDVVHLMLGPSTLLIVGGTSHWWWPTRERRLVDRLASEGYSTVFADIGAARRRALAQSRLLRSS